MNKGIKRHGAIGRICKAQHFDVSQNTAKRSEVVKRIHKTHTTLCPVLLEHNWTRTRAFGTGPAHAPGALLPPRIAS